MQADESGGTCLKLCIPTATFQFDVQVSGEELRSGQLRACRNRELECYEGVVPPAGGANTVDFAEASYGNGPAAASFDEWRTLYFTWQGLNASPPLADGDRFTLTLLRPSGNLTLLDEVAHFETTSDCGGLCLSTSGDLRRAPDGQGGSR